MIDREVEHLCIEAVLIILLSLMLAPLFRFEQLLRRNSSLLLIFRVFLVSHACLNPRIISEEVVLILVSPHLPCRPCSRSGCPTYSRAFGTYRATRQMRQIFLPWIMQLACLQSVLILAKCFSFSSSIAVSSNALLLSDLSSFPGNWSCLFPMVDY